MREVFLKLNERHLLIRISNEQSRHEPTEIEARLLRIGLIRRTREGVWVTTDEGVRWLAANGQ